MPEIKYFTEDKDDWIRLLRKQIEKKYISIKRQNEKSNANCKKNGVFTPSLLTGIAAIAFIGWVFKKIDSLHMKPNPFFFKSDKDDCHNIAICIESCNGGIKTCP